MSQINPYDVVLGAKAKARIKVTFLTKEPEQDFQLIMPDNEKPDQDWNSRVYYPSHEYPKVNPSGETRVYELRAIWKNGGTWMPLGATQVADDPKYKKFEYSFDRSGKVSAQAEIFWD